MRLSSQPPYFSIHRRAHTWRVDDGQVWAVLVFNLDDDLLRPELALSLQPCVLKLDVGLLPQHILSEVPFWYIIPAGSYTWKACAE